MMSRILGLLLAGLWAMPQAAPLNVCLISGSSEYKSEASLVEFQKVLEGDFGVKCSRSFGKDGGKDLPGLEALEQADVVVVFARRMTLPQEQMDRLQKFCRSGKGVIGIRTASHAFQNWPEFDKEVLGGDYKGHYGPAQADVRIDENNKSHPVLAEVKPFRTPGKLYKNPAPSGDHILLLSASTPGYTEPVLWARDRKEGRVVYTSLGVPEDFTDQNFRRLLINAVFWVARREFPKK